MKTFSKGQISIFIIVSIILVIGAVFIISFNSDSIRIFADEKSSYKIKEFVENCLEVESKIAVEKIGLAGGWLYYSGKGNMPMASMNKPEIFNKNARGLHFLDRIEMPYWYYYHDSDEEFLLNVPEYDTDDKYSLKNQVKMYLEENLDKNCIRGFVVYDDIYDIDYEPKQVRGKINVEFDKDEIITSLDMPLEIRELNKETIDYVDFFQAKVDNKLWIPYHMAIDIVLAEHKSAFIEKRILGFLSAYQTANNKEMLPPFYDFKMDYDFAPWEVPKVEKLVKQIINANIGLIQFLNSDVHEPKLPDGLVGMEFVRGFSNTYTKDYLSEHSITKDENTKIFRKYDEYSIRPVYEDMFFPMSFNLAPSMGDVILLPRPEAVISFLPFFFTEYTAVYEMTTPIVFEIRDSQSYNDKFVFKLPIETNIDHNTPLIENVDYDVNLADLGATSKKSLICNPLQYISDYVYINITDPVYHGLRDFDDPEIGVEDAIVNFDCKGLSECFITQTEINGRYLTENITELKFRLPINCDPGTLEIFKFGHRKIVVDNLNPKIDGIIDLGEKHMPSKKKMEVIVKLVQPGMGQFSTGSGIGTYDHGFLIMQHLEDDTIVEVIDFNRSNQDSLTMDLTVGNYSVQGFIIYENEFTIPATSIEGHAIPAMDFTSWVRGSIEREKFEVRLDDLLSREIMTVPFIDVGIPKSLKDLQTMADEMTLIQERGYNPYLD